MDVSKVISVQDMMSFIQSRMGYDQIRNVLQSKNPTARGLSPSSIRRFCQINVLETLH